MSKERRSEGRILRDRLRKYILREMTPGLEEAVDGHSWNTGKGTKALNISSAGEMGEGGEEDAFWTDEAKRILRAEGRRWAKAMRTAWAKEDKARRKS